MNKLEIQKLKERLSIIGSPTGVTEENTFPIKEVTHKTEDTVFNNYLIKQ